MRSYERRQNNTTEGKFGELVIVDKFEVINVISCMEEHIMGTENQNATENAQEVIEPRKNSTDDGVRSSKSNADSQHGDHNHGASR